MIILMKKKLSKKGFRVKLRGKEGKIFWLGLFCIPLFLGLWCGRGASENYREWEKRRYYRKVEEIVKLKERALKDALITYNEHGDLGGEDLRGILMVVDGGISEIDRLAEGRKKADQKVDNLVERNLEASKKVLAELKNIIEFLLKIQPCYKRFEASASDLLKKDFNTTGLNDYFGEKRKMAEADFEACKKIEIGDFGFAQEKFLAILRDYVELLKRGEWVLETKSNFLYQRLIDEYREKIKKEIDGFNEAIDLKNLDGFKRVEEEKKKLDEEVGRSLEYER
jgi:hypothetical protein